MNNELKKVLEEIDSRISNYENFSQYKSEEIQILESIITKYSFYNIYDQCEFEAADLLICAVILKNKYENIKKIQEEINLNKELINNYWMSFSNIISKIYKFQPSEKNLGKILKRMRKNDNGKIKKATDEEKNTCMYIYKLYEICDTDFFNNISQIIKIKIYMKQFLSKLNMYRKLTNLNKEFKFVAEEKFDIETIENQLKRVIDLYDQFRKINSKELTKSRKMSMKLLELKNILLLCDKKEEITSIDKIMDLIPAEDKELVDLILRYIASKNSIYYKKLDEQYATIKGNSITDYVRIFLEKGINFESYTKAEQNIILRQDLDFVSNVLDFLAFIDYPLNNNIISIIVGTSESIIENIKEYLKNGILTRRFVQENIGILLTRSLTNNNALYELLIVNINLFLTEGINIIGLDEDSLKVFLEDSNIIRENFKLLEELKINIKTRILKNYSFIGNKSLKTMIIMLQQDINLNDNIELINSDINVVKRIKICKCIGVEIYTKEGKIRDEILDEKQFFIPNSKLDDYIENKELKLD